jgi:hypothetical protein
MAHLTPTLQLQCGLDLGLGAFQRSAQVRGGNFERTPDQRSVSFLAGPRLNLRWSPTWYAVLGVSLGVDLLTMPAAYEIEYASGRMQLERLAWAQPWLTVWLLGLSR